MSKKLYSGIQRISGEDGRRAESQSENGVGQP
jgi:hypothetical protein